MPNDLVSREVVTAAVRECFTTWARMRTHPMEHDVLSAIAALPAAGDERWEKLRAFVVRVGDENVDCVHPDYFDATEDILAEMDAIDGTTWEQRLEQTRHSPPPQEAGDE